uniref:U-box domain-containing protein n=1 Tax=Trypanosoma congolense (strain IL3000) TaxID=1068625 RepID=G0V051_TRYCI|nr:conserved hypothetical protein [Trypanosoma congolense IL3000]
MSGNGAIASLIAQNPEDVSISVLSCVVASLSAPGMAQDVVEKDRPVCCKLMERLVMAANDSTKNAGLRRMAIECLYALSNVPNDEFRRGDLWGAVQKLNESFEAFLESQGVGEDGGDDSQHEMLTVLLLRCGGYGRLSAGDLLQQIFAGDVTRFMATLQVIIKNRSLEWDILHACMRCMYQLSTPSSYFVAPDGNQPIETTKISDFQDKIASLLVHLCQQNALQEVFAEITARWEAAVREHQFDLIINGKNTLSASAASGVVMNYVLIFRYISVMLLNVADFCERMDLVHSYQSSLTSKHQGFLVNPVVPFIRLAIRAWEVTRDPTAPADSQENPYMNVAVLALRLLRFAFYHTAPMTLQEPLVLALASLTEQVHLMEPLLRTEYVGMLVLVLTTEVLCNVNASTVPALSKHFTSFVTLLVEDRSPLRPGAQFTTAQAFAYCIANDTSTYCVNENESVSFLREKLRSDETVAIGEATMAIRALEEQLTMLQSLMMELAIGQLLGDLCLLVPEGEEGRRGLAGWASAMQLSNAAAAGKETGGERKRNQGEKKRKHPQEYVCMLTKKLMREPVVLSNGNRYEFDALQKVADRVGHVDPLTGEAFNEEILVDVGLQQEIARYRVEMAARGDKNAIP